MLLPQGVCSESGAATARLLQLAAADTLDSRRILAACLLVRLAAWLAVALAAWLLADKPVCWLLGCVQASGQSTFEFPTKQATAAKQRSKPQPSHIHKYSHSSRLTHRRANCEKLRVK